MLLMDSVRDVSMACSDVIDVLATLDCNDAPPLRSGCSPSNVIRRAYTDPTDPRSGARTSAPPFGAGDASAERSAQSARRCGAGDMIAERSA